MNKFIFGFAVILILANGCSEKHGESPTSLSYEALPAPENLVLTPGDWEMTLDWEYPVGDEERVSNFIIYRYYMTAYGEYLEVADTTEADVREFVDSGLIGNVEYCYLVSAVDSNGIEGWRTGVECELTEAH